MRAGSSILVALLVAACAPPPQPPPPVVAIAAPPSPPAAAPKLPDEGPPAQRRPRAPLAAAAPAPLDTVRNPRLRSPRAAALLITEIQGLESLLATLPATNPDRPRLIRRMADSYAELEATAQREGKGPRFTEPPRRAAIRYYAMLAQRHPTWCASPHPSDPAKSTGCADEAFYYLALERERDGDVTGARTAYFQLVQRWPQSRLVPSAYLAFGEMFLAEAAAFQAALPYAEQSYREVLKYPPPENAVYGYAQYQLGRVRVLSGDPKGGAAALEQAIAWAQAYPSADGAADIASAARQELTALSVP